MVGGSGKRGQRGRDNNKRDVGYVGTMKGFVQLLIIFCSSGSVTSKDKLSDLDAPT